MVNFFKGGAGDRDVFGDGSSDEAADLYRAQLAATGGILEEDTVKEEEDEKAPAALPDLDVPAEGDEGASDEKKDVASESKDVEGKEDESNATSSHSDDGSSKQEDAQEESNDKTTVLPSLSLSSLEDLDEPSPTPASSDDDSGLPASLRRQRAQDKPQDEPEKKKPVLERAVPSFSIPDFGSGSVGWLSEKKLTVACAVLASISLISIGFAAVTFMNGGGGAAEAPVDTVSCVALAESVESGDIISADMLTEVEVPAQWVPSDVARSADEVDGLAAVTNLTAGLPISLSCLEGSKDPADLTTSVRAGYVAQMFSIDTAAGLSPFLAPGDYVDITYGDQTEGTVELKTLENVRVLAVGDELTGGQTDEYSSLTFELTERDAAALGTATGMYVTAVPRSEWPEDAVGGGSDEDAEEESSSRDTADEESSSERDNRNDSGSESTSGSEDEGSSADADSASADEESTSDAEGIVSSDTELDGDSYRA